MRLTILLIFAGIFQAAGATFSQSSDIDINAQSKIVEDDPMEISTSSAFEIITVSGTVISATDQTPLPGVNVIVKGTTVGTITDISGKYSLDVEGDGTILVFSYVGFLNEEIEVGNQNVINVSLAESIEALEEIIVTGLSIERDKESLGYSVTQLGGDEVNEVKADNFANALSGKVAGLQITESATGVGGSTRIILRGITSISGNNRPLFVIDGIPMLSGYNGGNNTSKDGGDALADINPEDIESISVLKGAGAAAVYGSRAANGVILITTKKGALNKGFNISFNSTYMRNDPLVLPDLQNVYGQGGLRGSYPITNPNNTVLDHPSIWSYGPRMDSSTVIGWTGEDEIFASPENQFKYYFQTGQSFINNLAVDLGNENSSLRVSLTDQRTSGIAPGNNLSRQTFSARGFTRQNIFEMDAKVTYVHHNVENRPILMENGGNAPLSLSILPRNISAQSLEENTTDEFGNEMTWLLDETFGNPYWMLENQGNNDIKDRYQVSFSIKTDITKKLYLLLRTGLDQAIVEDKNWTNSGTKTASNSRGNYSHSMNNRAEWNSDFLLSYENSAGQFSYGFSLGGNYRIDKYSSISQWGSGLQIPGYYHMSNLSEFYTNEYSSRYEVASLYALGNVSYKDALYFDLTYRSDWSSSLPSDNNQFNYYSLNLSWLFTNTINLPKWFSTGKLRGSIAQTGNDTGPYRLENVYNVIQSPLPYSMVSIPGELKTPELLPEINNTWEIGTDLGFIDNRLLFNFTYYYSLAKNQIMSVPIPISTSYSSKVLNSGEVQNSGIELQLDAVIISKPSGFNWDATLIYTKNNSLVKSIHPDLNSIILNSAWHATIEARPGEEYGLIYGYDWKRDANGNRLIDSRGWPIQSDSLISHGSINPDFTFGFRNSFSYKGVTLSFLIDGTIGAKIYSWGKTYKMLWGTDAETLEGREEWFETHDENGFPISGVEPGGYIFEGVMEDSGEPNTTPLEDPAYRGYLPYKDRVITESVLDASSIRIREAMLSYTFPHKLVSKWKMTNLTLALTGRNLYFFYKPADHIDPEAGYSSGNTGNGIEQSTLPSTRSIGFNLRVGF
jgi:TonB-linked SusC/RagA family outer membrane protein